MSSLRWWSWRLGSKREAEAPVAKRPVVSPLTFVEMTSLVRRAPIEIVLASGTKVLVPADFEDGALERVLVVLSRQR